MKIKVEATMDSRWIPEFIDFLATMEYCGGIGTSRKLSFYSDGDGDFHPKFKINGEPLEERAIEIANEQNSFKTDFDAG